MQDCKPARCKDNKFNAIKNALARDIIGYLNKAEYLGWRTVIEGKEPAKRNSVLMGRLPEQLGLPS